MDSMAELVLTLKSSSDHVMSLLAAEAKDDRSGRAEAPVEEKDTSLDIATWAMKHWRCRWSGGVRSNSSKCNDSMLQIAAPGRSGQLAWFWDAD